MSGGEPALSDRAPLLDLLDRAFDRGRPDGPGSHPIAVAHWERALRAPLREFLSRPGKELRARLVELGFALGADERGATARLPAELPWLVELVHAGSLIVDDIEDGSELRRGRAALHHEWGIPVALNAANWLYFWPQALIAESGLPAEARLAAHERFAACLLRCHEGQALDLTVRVQTLARGDVPHVVRALTALKTGKLLELATSLGAIAALAGPERTHALASFGCELGVGLQMLDDLSGVLNPRRRDKGSEDLRLGRATWVFAWLAEELDSADYGALIRQLKEAQGEDGGADAYEPLLTLARFRLHVSGLRRVRTHLAATLGALEQVVGSGRWAHELREELTQLERRFMEGA